MSEDIMVNGTGFLILKRHLNFNVSPKYNFTVMAQASHKLQTLFLGHLMGPNKTRLLSFLTGPRRVD